MKQLAGVIAISLIFLTAPSNDVALTNYKLMLAFPALRFELPVELTGSNDHTDRIFVVEQKGRIIVFPNKSNSTQTSVFLDIIRKVDSGGEKGLLGFALHPDYKSNGYFFVNYTRSSPLQSVISRFRVSELNAQIADADSEEILLTYDQPFSNHNGGKIAFGRDGYLYISTGDGGSGGDPRNNGQDRKSLLGKILRIDVNKASGKSKYSIPPDNPFKNSNEGFREEIYAYGLRNVWRFNFDNETGMLWAGDVGQNELEEIDIIENGGNYGWKIMEGQDCFRSRNCDPDNFLLPVWSYRQGSETGRSITGGYVCRDRNLPALSGKYIYGDFVSGRIWALTYAAKRAVKNELVSTLSDGLSSFGQDKQKNLYVLAYGSGHVYKFVESD
jgi:glucose/arabinose dehydrogenase